MAREFCDGLARWRGWRKGDPFVLDNCRERETKAAGEFLDKIASEWEERARLRRDAGCK